MPRALVLLAAATAAGFMLALAPTTGAFAAGATPTPAAQPDRNFDLTGTVDSVSYAGNTFELVSPQGKVKIAITPTTAIAAHGQVGGVSDVRRGVRLTASGVVHNGVYTALTITIK